MDIQALKLDLVEKIIRTDHPSILLKINKILQNKSDEDWWEKLPPEIQESIKEGIKDVEKGSVVSHEQVITEAKQKYGF